MTYFLLCKIYLFTLNILEVKAGIPFSVFFKYLADDIFFQVATSVYIKAVSVTTMTNKGGAFEHVSGPPFQPTSGVTGTGDWRVG